MMTEGSVNCLALHKKGLFAAGHDGVVRKLDLAEIIKDNVKVVDVHALGVPVTSLTFNTLFNKLAVGSSRVWYNILYNFYFLGLLK